MCVEARPILCGEMLASESAQRKRAGQPLRSVLAVTVALRARTGQEGAYGISRSHRTPYAPTNPRKLPSAPETSSEESRYHIQKNLLTGSLSLACPTG